MKRQPIRSIPSGSPQAGPVRVYSLETGGYLRTDKAMTAAHRDTPGHSIEQYAGQRWAKPNGNTATETEGDDA